MANLTELMDTVARARQELIAELVSVTDMQATWQPAEDQWSIAQVVEHLVLAEDSGVIRMWQAVADLRNGEPGWRGEVVHCGRTIEEIIALTWRDREDAPANCVPQANGPLPYWLARLAACQPVLEALGQELAGLDLTAVIAPHFLSGPLDADQRFQFLRWHIAHHRQQIDAVMAADAARLVPA